MYRFLFQQNADLVVLASADLHPSQTGPAHTLNLMAITDAADLVQWEFAAYASYGEARCDAEKIETLSDLFGPEFETVFRNRHRVLLAQHRLIELQSELERICDDISNAEQVIANRGILPTPGDEI